MHGGSTRVQFTGVTQSSVTGVTYEESARASALMVVRLWSSLPAHSAQPGGRALAIEDYYHVQTVGSLRSRPTGAGSSSRSPRASSRTTAPAVKSTSRQRMDPSRRGACCTTAVMSATRRGPTTVVCNTRSIGSQWVVDPANHGRRARASSRRCPTARCEVPTERWIALAKDKPQARAGAVYAHRTSNAVTKSDSRACSSTGRTFSATDSPSPRPNLRARPAQQTRDSTRQRR